MINNPKPMNPLVSIVTVSFNSDEDLEKTIQSVIQHRDEKVQYVIIDGGSTDKTLEILHKYDSQIDYWISESDDGIYHAMNKAIQYCRGQWIYFIGAGDLLIYELSLLENYLKNTNHIYYGNVILKQSQKKYGEPFQGGMLFLKNIHHQSIFYPATVFDNYQYDPKFKVYADYLLNLQIYVDGLFMFEYLDLDICLFDESGISSRQKNPYFKLLKMYYLLKKPDLLISPNFYRNIYRYLGERKFLNIIS